MAYDPEDLGAQCYQCVLKSKRVGGPVPPEIHGKETVAVINDVPSQKDCDENRPLTDGGGMEFTRTLQNCGEHRKNVAIFNAIPCRPPENDFDKLMLQWQRQNKKLIAAGQDPLPSPIECCRPRLMQEIAPYQNLVTLGKVAYKAVTGSSAAILEMRGGPIEGRLDEGHFTFKPAETPGQTVTGHWPIKLMPTIHPGMVIRARRWTKAFNTDIARAFRFFKDRLNWAKPWMRFTPTPDEIRKFLWSTDQFAYDTETTVEDATVARLKCITVSTGDGGICIPFYSIESNSSVYRDDELEEIKGILRQWFTDPNILKTGWNSGGFDVHIIENHLGVTPTPMLDGILLHRLVESELPHRLGYVGSVYLDVTAWKAAHTAKEARSDMELWTYGITDTIVTHRVIEILASAVEAKEQVHLVEKDHKIQQMCSGMKHVGMWVDREQRIKEAVRVQADIIKFRQAALRASGKPDLNLNSTYKLRDLLFSDWDLAPSEYTKTGDPSTSDDAMRLIRSQNLSNPQVTAFIDALRMFRRASKEYGTYIARMIPYGQSVDDVNLEWFDEDEEDPEVARGLIMRDGRVHPNYLAHGTTCVTPETWVLTSNGPQQIGRISGFGPEGSDIPATNLSLHNGDQLNVASHQIHPKPAECLSVQTVLGFDVTGPAHHRIQVAQKSVFSCQGKGNKNVLVEPDWAWKRMDEVTDADYVRVPYGMNCWSPKVATFPEFDTTPPRTNAVKINLPTKVSLELCEFAGAYNADGSLHDANGSFSIRLTCRTDPARRQRLAAIATGLFGEEAVRESSDGVAVTSVALAPWVEAAGLMRGGANKRIPDWILESPKEYVIAYLRGLSIDSSMSLHDGVTPRWRFSNYEGLTREVQILLLNLGIPASRRYVGSKHRPNSWEIMVQGSTDVEILCGFLGLTPPAPIREVAGPRPKYIRREKNLWLRVKAVSSAGIRSLRDVTIPNGAAFWSNGVVSHNSGRLSSSNPNSQNFPKHLRGMVKAAPGHILVGADADQLELRIISSIAQIPIYLEAFAKGDDPHSHTAAMMFGEHFTKLEKKSTQWKNLRTLAKGIKYASFYGSGDETVHGIVTSAENEKGELLFPDLTLKQLRTIRRKWLNAIPQLPAWWDACLDYYRRHGCMRDPVWGRRRDFLDGEKFNEIVNFGPQSSGAHIIHEATFRILQEIPFEKWGKGTGLINQCHDALVFEVPYDHDQYTGEDSQYGWCKKGCNCTASMVANLIKREMNVAVPGLPGVMFAAKPDIAMRWSEV
jgi:DNA polymerase I-like protein with 3'-5' exonuclease and polymerase domains/uracil-DNA glycosylase